MIHPDKLIGIPKIATSIKEVQIFNDFIPKHGSSLVQNENVIDYFDNVSAMRSAGSRGTLYQTTQAYERGRTLEFSNKPALRMSEC